MITMDMMSVILFVKIILIMTISGMAFGRGYKAWNILKNTLS
jgi:hypothetical protein